MAELDKRKPVSLEELMLANLAQTDALTEVLIEKGVITEGRVKAEAVGEACGLPAHSESDSAMKPPGGARMDRASFRQNRICRSSVSPTQ